MKTLTPVVLQMCQQGPAGVCACVCVCVCVCAFCLHEARSQVVSSGDTMQPVHRKHYAKFRLRCVKERCGLVFCGGCGVQPYHEGYSCEEWKRREDGLSCRCERVLFIWCQKELFSLNLVSDSATLKFELTPRSVGRGWFARRPSASYTPRKAAQRCFRVGMRAVAVLGRTSG